MAIQQPTGFCKHCNKQVMANRTGVNHILHFLIAFFTCGAQALVWIGLCIKLGGWKCSSCGLPVSSQTNKQVLPKLIIFILLIIFVVFLIAYPNFKTVQKKTKTKITQQQLDIATKTEVIKSKEKTKIKEVKKKNIEKPENNENNIVNKIKQMQKAGLLSEIELHSDKVYVVLHKWKKHSNEEKEKNINIIKTYCGATKSGFLYIRDKYSGKLISKLPTTKIKIKKTVNKKNIVEKKQDSNEYILRKKLKYLTKLKEVSWYEIDNNNVYIGFSSVPNDLSMVIKGAAIAGNKAINFGVHVWAIKASEKGWRPGDGHFYKEVTARYGKIE